MMMKVLLGFFTTESNTNLDQISRIKDYDLAFNEECIVQCKVKEVFDENNIETIGSVYANAAGSGRIELATFQYIEDCFINAVREHLHELDGIWLHLHGASAVEQIGSGDHHILKKIREMVGPYLPIAVVALFKKVDWKPIQHTVNKSIDDLNKKK